MGIDATCLKRDIQAATRHLGFEAKDRERMTRYG